MWNSEAPLSPLTGNRNSSLYPLLLVAGFSALIAAVLVAHSSPATGYESSIYGETPVGFWIGIGFATLVFLVVSTASDVDAGLRQFGLFLGGNSFVALAALPLIRGYHFFGHGDPLTHLGYVRDVLQGELSPLQLFYPGTHFLAAFVRELLHLSLPRSLMIAVFAFAVVFVLFLPLVVQSLVSHDLAVTVGLISAILFLPVNQIATHYMAFHPMTEAILLFPFVVFVLIRYVQSSATTVGLGLLLALTSAATVFYHPMQATAVIVLFATVSTIQFVSRRYYPDHPLSEDRLIYGQTAFLMGVYAVWTFPKGVFIGTVARVTEQLRELLSGQTATTGSVVQHQSTSLTAVGASLTELFVKLFLVSAVFSLVAGLVSASSIAGRTDSRSPAVKYLAVALVVLGVVSLPLFVGDVSKLFFRMVGSMMVLVTVLGAVGLLWATDRERLDVDTRRARIAVLVCLAVLVVHSAAIVFTSPYIYQPNRQITEAQMTGYETAFTRGDTELTFTSIRSGPGRYMHAIYGTYSVPASLNITTHNYDADVSGENLTRLGSHFESDGYLVLTDRGVSRETNAYRELRYSRTQLRSVRTQRSVHRVQSNGAFRLYLYDANRSVTDGSAR